MAATLFIPRLHCEAGQSQFWNVPQMDFADYAISRMAQRAATLEDSGVKFFDVAIPWRQKRYEVVAAIGKISKILVSAPKR